MVLDFLLRKISYTLCDIQKRPNDCSELESALPLVSLDGYERLCIQDAILDGRFVNIQRK